MSPLGSVKARLRSRVATSFSAEVIMAFAWLLKEFIIRLPITCSWLRGVTDASLTNASGTLK